MPRHNTKVDIGEGGKDSLLRLFRDTNRGIRTELFEALTHSLPHCLLRFYRIFIFFPKHCLHLAPLDSSVLDFALRFLKIKIDVFFFFLTERKEKGFSFTCFGTLSRIFKVIFILWVFSSFIWCPNFS